MAVAICIICCNLAFFDKYLDRVFSSKSVCCSTSWSSLSQSRLAAEGLMPKRALKSRLKWLRLA